MGRGASVMREIIFDTETTGLDAREDRIIELGGVELVNRFPTGRTFHKFINPQGRAINPEAEAVHGISAAQLVGQPNFAEICAEFLEFVEDAKLVAHNAGFDMGFINAEFGRLGYPAIGPERWSTRWRWRAASIPWAPIRSMRCAVATASTTATAPSTGRCSIPNFWPKSMSN